MPDSFRRLLIATAAALLPLPGAAQERLPPYQADTLVVTSKRYPALPAELPQRVEVITERELTRSSADELADVLKEHAAVDVVQYPGLLSAVGIRGFRPEIGGSNQRTLLLVDGRPAGTTNLATFDLGALERIEVLKGPSSSLYGSGAMGGAVNLITRRSTGALSGRLAAGYGSFETSELSGRIGGSLSPRIDFDAGGARFSRGDDYRVGEGNFFRGLVGSEEATRILFDRTTEPADEIGDGVLRPNSRYGYGSASARVGIRLMEGLRGDLRGDLFRAADVETPADLYDPFQSLGQKDLDRHSGDLSLSGVRGRHAPLLRAFRAEESAEYYATWAPDPFVSYVSDAATNGIQLQDIIAVGGHTLTAGVDYTAIDTRSRAFSGANEERAPFTPNAAASAAALFAETKLSLLSGRLVTTLGGRADRTSLELRSTPLRSDIVPGTAAFTVFSPSAGAQLTAGGGVRVHGTVGSAFVAPDAFRKAGLSLQSGRSGAIVTVGNAGLAAERSLTYDVGVGLERRELGVNADVTYFRTRVDDRITPVFAAFPTASAPRTSAGDTVATVITYANANEARMEGVEWRVGYDLGARAGYRYSLRIFANATHIWRAEERVRGVAVDAARFAGRTDFRPEEVLGALSFTGERERDIYSVADATLNYGVEYDDLRRISVRVAGRYVGERLDQDFTDSRFPDVRYPAFATLDAVATLRLGGRYTAAFLVDNLTDENYYEKRGFSLPGRSLRLRLSAEM